MRRLRPENFCRAQWSSFQNYDLKSRTALVISLEFLITPWLSILACLVLMDFSSGECIKVSQTLVTFGATSPKIKFTLG